MDLKHLRYFVAVAEELHFTRAAARLHMSQPPLSQMIHRLEDDIGFKLLERTKRKVVLTDAGKVLLEEGRAILARAELAVQHAERASRGDVGNLKVGFIPWAEFTTAFSTAFRTFGERHPDVRVEFNSMMAPAAAAALADGRIDVAFLTLPPTPPRNLSYELALADSIVVALPERHPLAKRRVVPIKMLAKEPQIVVARDRVAAYYQLVELLCQQAGFLLNARHIVDHPQTTMALVAAEAGVSLVPASYENVRRPGVIYRPIRPSVSVKMIAAWKTDDKSSVVRAFLDALRTVKP